MREHVRKRGRTYSIVLDVGTDPATGKHRQQWHSGFRTKKEAEAELARLIHNVERGSDPFPSNLMVSEFVDRWLEHERARLRPTTHHRYTQLLRDFILPVIGGTRPRSPAAGAHPEGDGRDDRSGPVARERRAGARRARIGHDDRRRMGPVGGKPRAVG